MIKQKRTKMIIIMLSLAMLAGCSQSGTNSSDTSGNTMIELENEAIIEKYSKTDNLSTTFPEAKFDVKEEIVNIDFEGENMVGTLTYPKEQEDIPIVLMLHGFGGQMNSLALEGTEENAYSRAARVFSGQGYATLRIDFIGSGESDGLWEDTTVSGQIANAETAIDYIKTLSFVDENRIGIMGMSQGSWVAASTAARVPGIKTAILWVPVFSPEATYSVIMGKDVIMEGALASNPNEVLEYTNWGETSSMKARFFKEFYEINPLSEIGIYKGSLQVVVGMKDTLVYPQPAGGRMFLKYHKTYEGEKEELIVMEDMDHIFNVFAGESDKVDTAVVAGLEFIEETL